MYPVRFDNPSNIPCTPEETKRLQELQKQVNALPPAQTTHRFVFGGPRGSALIPLPPKERNLSLPAEKPVNPPANPSVIPMEESKKNDPSQLPPSLRLRRPQPPSLPRDYNRETGIVSSRVTGRPATEAEKEMLRKLMERSTPRQPKPIESETAKLMVNLSQR